MVVGHFTGPSEETNVFLYLLKWIIVSFHMPAFIFISGYFSKRAAALPELIKKLVIPYLVYEVIYYLFYTFIMHKETGLYLLRPKFTLWYLMVLFFWKMITPFVKKIPHYMLWAFAAGLLIGLSDIPNNFLSIPRALVFYPYFLAGTNFDRERIPKLRSRKMQWTFAGLVLLISFCVCMAALYGNVSMKVFYGRYNFVYLNQGILEGMLWRIAGYVIGFSMTYALMALIPERKTFYSYIGTRTMAIYLFHGLAYSYLEYCTGILADITTMGGAALLLAGCVAVTVLFSWIPFTRFTNKISHLY